MARVLVLGLNLWAVGLAGPALIAGDVAVALGSLATLIPLALGIASRGRKHLGSALLLAVFPASLLMGVLALDRRSGSAHPPLALVLGSISLLAFGAVTAQILGRPTARADVRHREMGDVAGDPSAARRRWLRRAVLAIAAVGALALALVAPFVGGEAALTTAWGDAAEAAGTLSASVGGALSALVLAAFVGPGLRSRRSPPVTRQRWRVGMYLLVATSGAGVFILLTRS